jgi:two-component system sensor histidine kinase QseC
MKVEPIDLLLEPRIAGAAHPWSLRRRLMFIVGVGSVTAWLVGGVGVLMLAREQSQQLHIARLDDFAHILMRFAEHELDEIRAERPGEIVHIETAQTLDRRLRYQVRNANGELVLVSADTALEPFCQPFCPPRWLATEKSRSTESSTMCTRCGTQRTLHLQVIERPDEEAFALAILGRELAAGFIVTVITLLAVKMWMLRRATHALDQAATQLVNRSPGDLQPIVADNPPSELVPMLKAINCLFARFKSAMEAEHAFSAKAAHELRTPLAAVRIQAQVADRASETGGAHEALQQLGVCVERASRMIDQLLTLALREHAGSADFDGPGPH